MAFVGSDHDPWREAGDYPFGAEVLVTATEIAAASGLEVREGKPSVDIQRVGETEWNSVKIGDHVAEGDSLRTGAQSWALLEAIDTRVRPEENPGTDQIGGKGFASRVAAFFKPKAVIAAVVVGLIDLIVQLFMIKGSQADHSNVAILGPALGWANTVTGSIFWAIFPFLAFALIGYAVSRASRRVGRV